MRYLIQKSFAPDSYINPDYLSKVKFFEKRKKNIIILLVNKIILLISLYNFILVIFVLVANPGRSNSQIFQKRIQINLNIRSDKCPNLNLLN